MRRLTPSGSRLTSTPPTVAVPLVGFSSPQSMRIVVDLPAPLLPRKPNTSPWRTSNVSRSTATKSPKRFVRSVTAMVFIGASLFAQGARQPRVRQMRVCDRLRAIQVGLQERHLRVEDVGARGDAGGKPIAEHAAGFGRAADRIGGRLDGCAARG